MNLDQYLRKHKITYTDFAEKIGYGRTYINEIGIGTKNPSKRLAKLIEQATNGEVTAEELLKDKGVNGNRNSGEVD